MVTILKLFCVCEVPSQVFCFVQPLRQRYICKQLKGNVLLVEIKTPQQQCCARGRCCELNLQRQRFADLQIICSTIIFKKNKVDRCSSIDRQLLGEIDNILFFFPLFTLFFFTIFIYFLSERGWSRSAAHATGGCK